MAVKAKTKRSTLTNNAELGAPQIPVAQHALLNGIKVHGGPVIVQVDFETGRCKGVLNGAKVKKRIVTDPSTGEKVKVEVGGHSYKVSTPSIHRDNSFVSPKVFVDGVQQKVTKMAARAATEANKGKNICARFSVVVPLEGRTVTCLDPSESDNPTQIELTEGFLIIVVKDRLTSSNSADGTIEVVGFSKTAERESWNI